MKEMAYNRSLVDELSQEVQNLRNTANGGVLDAYLGYFPFGRAIFAQTTTSANNGILYELLSTDQIKDVQKINSLLSFNNENWVNSEITKRKNILINTPESFDRAELIKFINHIENQIRALGLLIDGLIKELQ
jgi:hypothetical protein